jgi:hypothetical protein
MQERFPVRREELPMSRTTAEIFSDLTPTGPQPLPQGGLYIQAPFHPTDHLTVYLTTEDVGELLDFATLNWPLSMV